MEGEYPYWGSNGIVDYVNKFIFNEEIVLVGEDGSPFFDKLKDVSFYVNEPVWVNNHIHILRPKDRILPKYLTHSFNCVDYKEYITGSTRDKLTQSDLKRISHCVCFFMGGGNHHVVVDCDGRCYEDLEEKINVLQAPPTIDE